MADIGHPEGTESALNLLVGLSRKLFAVDPERVEKLPAHASARKYFRASFPSSAPSDRLIGTVGDNLRENASFIAFAKHFASVGLPVPTVYTHVDYPECYFQQDLGDVSLSQVRVQASAKESLAHYKRALAVLLDFQLRGAMGLPRESILGRTEYDATAMRWDIDGFKYSLLRPLGISVDDEWFEDATRVLLSKLQAARPNVFMHRDFQSRNIIVHDQKLFVIDFQGGRMGPPQYDLASCLYQGSAKLTFEERELLLKEYLALARTEKAFKVYSDFESTFPYFAALFLLKVLGTYGLRGITDGKLYFLQAIPLALENFLSLHKPCSIKGIEYFSELIESVQAKLAPLFITTPQGILSVDVSSFSYRNGIPRENPLHGGGFVFDCRALPNPHHSEELRSFNGREEPIQTFLLGEPKAQEFYANASALTNQMIEEYLAKGYSRLSVAFGCTGGKHRSVFMAERLAEQLRKNQQLSISLKHRELD